MESKQRESGFYWVKDDYEWLIMEYFNFENRGGFWLETGVRTEYLDEDFEEIDERKLTHDLP